MRPEAVQGPFGLRAAGVSDWRRPSWGPWCKPRCRTLHATAREGMIAQASAMITAVRRFLQRQLDAKAVLKRHLAAD